MEAAARELGELATFLSVNIDEATLRHRAEDIATKHGVAPHRLAIRGQGIADPAWRIFGSMPEARFGVPLYVVIDKSGVIRHAGRTLDEARAALQTAAR